MKRSILIFALSAISLVSTVSRAAEFMEQSEKIRGRTYSEAVATEGGRIVWLAGQTAITDLNGKDIRGDAEAQARTAFAQLDETLKRAGGSLKNIVNLTVYLTDVRNGGAFQKVRAEMFPDKNYPASAQVTVSALAVPGMLVEIQAIAVIGDKCSKSSPCFPR
ncbi:MULTISPECIES: RidA family protein [Polaromonas]|uniref:RidA family protein n=1 Tax=Polaromonas aquatica TaxID=332657 RepID=A0ABW1TQR2_9BURK